MAITAAIKFTQGATVGDAGYALVGVAGAAVTVANGNNATVVRWVFTILDVPPGSAVPVGVLSDGPFSTISFTPDAAGSYRIQLDVYTVLNLLHSVDVKAFIVPNSRGWMYPAFRETASEYNFKSVAYPLGNPRGWTTALEKILKDLEGLQITFDPTFVCHAACPVAPAGRNVALTSDGKITLANGAALAAGFVVLGIGKQALAPGALVSVIMEGAASPALTGLSTSASGQVRANTTTGACELVTTISPLLPTDYVVGGSNLGWLAMCRQINNAPIPITYASIGGLIGDYDANLIAGATGTAIATWPDSTPSAQNLVQATGAKQPTILAPAVFGRKAVSFDGITQSMRCANFIINSREMTVYFVMQLRVVGSGGFVFEYNVSTCAMNHAGTTGFPQQLRGGGSAGYLTNIAGAGFAIRSAQYRDDNTNELFYQGISRNTFTDSTVIPPNAPFEIGAHANSSGLFAPIDVARILVYNGKHSTAVNKIVYNLLAADYGFTPLP